MGKPIKRRQTIEIPEEIIEEILYKLPVKSLLRFKCVSKPWHSLISSKYFIKNHLNKSITKDENTADFTHHNKLIFTFEYSSHSTGLASCSLRNEPIIAPDLDIYPMGKLPSSTVIVGSCNGLILIKNNGNNKLLLWNPSTREVKNNIPAVSFDDDIGGHQVRGNLPGFFLYGFGYDEPRDDYKIVCIHIYSDHTEPSYQTQIYSSKTNSWKKIENFDRGFPDYRPLKFVNGRIHWLAGSPSSIVSFDLFEEKYVSVGCPKFFSNSSDFSMLKLEELGGYLGLMGRKNGDWDSLSVWAMMEYGNTESWTKIWTLSDFVADTMHYISAYLFPKPLYLKKNGNIAVALGLDIVVSNGKNELRKSRVAMPYDRVFGSVVYVESLVSCNPD